MKSKDFVRSDSNPGAILNVDNAGLQSYKRHREILRNVGTHEDRIKKIENDIGEVKDLLRQLVTERIK
jgi:t-SNARE complex subunit (syntaxin)